MNEQPNWNQAYRKLVRLHAQHKFAVHNQAPQWAVEKFKGALDGHRSIMEQSFPQHKETMASPAFHQGIESSADLLIREKNRQSIRQTR